MYFSKSCTELEIVNTPDPKFLTQKRKKNSSNKYILRAPNKPGKFEKDHICKAVVKV